VLQDVTNQRALVRSGKQYELIDSVNYLCIFKEFGSMLSDTQIFVALAIAIFPGILALRLATELYK
jgi:photosystem I subunit XII